MSNPKIYFTAFDNGSVHLSAKRFADDSWEWEMNKVEITNNVVMNPGVTADDFFAQLSVVFSQAGVILVRA